MMLTLIFDSRCLRTYVNLKNCRKRRKKPFLLVEEGCSFTTARYPGSHLRMLAIPQTRYSLTLGSLRQHSIRMQHMRHRHSRTDNNFNLKLALVYRSKRCYY